MSALVSILKEALGLFVDDGSLALTLILWVGIAGLGLPRLAVAPTWQAPMLFLGCLVILIVNVARSARGKGE